MQAARIDRHTAAYWASQIRLGAGCAAAVTLLAAVRILIDWPDDRRWWAVPLLVAVVAQAALVALPWRRLAARPGLRRWLVLWWVAELPVLWAFAAADADGLVAYLPCVALVLVTAAALYGPGTVIGLGVVSLGGYLALLPAQTIGDLVSASTLTAITASVAAVCAAGAISRRRLDNRRRAAERRMEVLLEASSDAVFAIDRQQIVRFASRSVQGVLGRSPEQLTGGSLVTLLDPAQRERAVAWMNDLLAKPHGHTARTEVRMLDVGGSWVHLDVIGTNRLGDPDLRAVVMGLRDVGHRRALEDQLSRQAYTDSLTGLPNRALFLKRLKQAAGRTDGTETAVLLLDLDDFKLVNDNLGHSLGDELLTRVAERLSREMRPGDTLARLGGDEFAILLEDVDEPSAVALADRLLRAGSGSFLLGSREVRCSLSIGIAGGTRPGGELLRDADLAMYAAKRAGRNAYAVFEPGMARAVLDEAELRADMERGLAGDQFTVLYQPIIDMDTRAMTGVEALVRWQHPQRGLIGPDTFIAAAEANGLIVPLGRRVLRETCAQLARWRAETPAAAGISVNVNLSARQFQDGTLVSDVAAAVADAGIAPADLTLEITESMLMADVTDAIDTLEALRRLGVRLAIDDFGTGYSSLAYLKRLPVDIIKIDRTFVATIDTDRDDVALVEAIVGLGKALRMRTVAEGIETEEQWSMLRRIGCDKGQGYLFGRPASVADIRYALDHPSAVPSVTG